MSAETPARPKRKLDVQVVTNNRKEGPSVQQTETLVGKAGELKLGVPVDVLKTDLSLLGSSTITKDRTPTLARSNPQCHNTRPQSCATCPEVPCSLPACK
ncbi:MAG TPA: hypothetical protein VLF93_02165 [Candidatus Saccharimonadales bacterium]|nr:hypothetical protein [Candidatus Saccharimonadales bacterium]